LLNPHDSPRAALRILLPAPQKVVDFQWCPVDPWLMMSVSDDTSPDEASPGGRGSRARDAAGAAAASAGAPARVDAAAAAAAGAVVAPGVPASSKDGGTLQLWRVNDLIYRPEEEVVEELEQHRCGGRGLWWGRRDGRRRALGGRGVGARAVGGPTPSA
jgi:hypothetical protein